MGYASIGIAAGVVLLLNVVAHAQPADLAPEQWKSLSKAVRIIRRDYVDPVDDQRLAQGCAQRVTAMPGVRREAQPPVGALTDVPPMLRAAATASVGSKDLLVECLAGMVESLDALSSFIPPQDGRQTGGGFAATGVELTRREQAIVVVEVYDGSPAASAGIRAGDRLAAIGGRSVDGLPLAEVTRRLRGRAGSAVTLTIARGAEVLDFTLTRAIVKVITVKAHVIAPAILHLKIRRFEESTLGEADAGVEPSRSLYVWFWNGKLVAFSATSSFKDDTTTFDDTKVAAIKPWTSLRADVVGAFGPPSGVAVYPTAPQEDHEVLIYSDFEWDTSKGQYGSKSLFVLVNALGLVEDVRFSGSTNPIPAPVVAPASTPIQIYTPPPRSRGR